MGVVATGESAVVTGGFDKPHWDLDSEENPWIYFYNRYRVQDSVHELKCREGLGCYWHNLDWALQLGRGYHVSFLVDGSEEHCKKN